MTTDEPLYAPIPPPWVPHNDFVPWPTDWPQYHNGGNDACDMLIGPCGCGAAHHRGEFLLRQHDRVLLRRLGSGRLQQCR